LRAKSPTTFRLYKIANFFPTRFKLWNGVLKMLNFQGIQKLISLHMHLNKTIIEYELSFLPKHFFNNNLDKQNK